MQQRRVSEESAKGKLLKQEPITSKRTERSELRMQRIKNNVTSRTGGELMPASKKISKKKSTEKKGSKKSKSSGFSRQPWTSEEDSLLMDHVTRYGQCWSEISRHMGGTRTHRQIRRRYLNELDPNIKKSAWSPEEDQILLEQYELLGRRWTEIAKAIPGRGEFATKNRLISQLKRLKLDGIQEKKESKIEIKRVKREKAPKSITQEKVEDSQYIENNQMLLPPAAELFQKGYHLMNFHIYNFLQNPNPQTTENCMEELAQVQGYDDYGIDRFLDFNPKTSRCNHQYLYKEDPMADLFCAQPFLASNVQDNAIQSFLNNHEPDFSDFGTNDGTVMKREESYLSYI